MDNRQSPVLGIVLKGYPRISETFISNEIRLLERNGYKIHIFSMRKPREPFAHTKVSEIEAQVTYMPSTLETSNLSRFLRPNLRAIRQNPIRYLRVFRKQFRRYRRTENINHIKHFLQAGFMVGTGIAMQNITHLHAHFAHSPTAVTVLAGHIANLPYSFTAHAKDIYTSSPKRLSERIDGAEFVITCTDYNKHYLQNLAPTQTPIYAVHHGIDLSLFTSNTINSAPEVPYTILTVARFVEKKGLPTVLRALATLKASGLAFRYVLVGTGEEEAQAEIIALLDQLGLAGQTELMGTLRHRDVIKKLREADLFVLGCQVAKNGDRDGIPNVLVESMAMGVPVVSTNISGIPELVQDGASGLLVPPENHEILAQALSRLLIDASLRARVIPNAQRLVREEFNNELLIQEIVDIYGRNQILPGSEPVSPLSAVDEEEVLTAAADVSSTEFLPSQEKL